MATFGRFVEFIEFAENVSVSDALAVLQRKRYKRTFCVVALHRRRAVRLEGGADAAKVGEFGSAHGLAFGDRGRFGGIGVREHCLRIIAPISKVRECYAGSPGRLV